MNDNAAKDNSKGKAKINYAEEHNEAQSSDYILNFCDYDDIH